MVLAIGAGRVHTRVDSVLVAIVGRQPATTDPATSRPKPHSLHPDVDRATQLNLTVSCIQTAQNSYKPRTANFDRRLIMLQYAYGLSRSPIIFSLQVKQYICAMAHVHACQVRHVSDYQQDPRLARALELARARLAAATDPQTFAWPATPGLDPRPAVSMETMYQPTNCNAQDSSISLAVKISCFTFEELISNEVES